MTRALLSLGGAVAACAWLLLAAQAPAAPEDATPPAASPWSLPPEGACAPQDGLRSASDGDAPPLPFAPGDVIDLQTLDLLEGYLPPTLWELRERFFFEGMRLEIGPCFRSFAPPGFFAAATARFAGKARLLEGGGIEHHIAGLPFPIAAIRVDDPQAGLRFAWNAALRYRGAGFRGRFRIADILGESYSVDHYEGEIFQVRLSGRADRPGAGYQAAGARDDAWVAGGLFTAPGSAREFAWRQFRSEHTQRDPDKSDELHAYLPTARRVVRLTAAYAEGLYLPSFAVGTKQGAAASSGGGPMGPALGAAGAVTGAGGASIPSQRTGFEGLELRPALYRHQIVGVRDVLAPINLVKPVYPEERERTFGPWAISFADDRWDLRRALVLRSTRKRGAVQTDVREVVRYLDLETLVPLYYFGYDAKGELLAAGLYAGRWSEDRPDYPPWPDDPKRPVRVLDPVGAAFTSPALDTSWRRESWDMVATPLGEGAQQKLLSVNQLTKRR